MRIDPDKCIACGNCLPYCPMAAIAMIGDIAVINEDECVECDCCFDFAGCPTAAIEKVDLAWPRILRNQFSNPVVPTVTSMTGRGSEEMKTNDVTNQFRAGFFGLGVELGRPGIGVRFDDVEKVTMALAPHINKFAAVNPVTELLEDRTTGKIRAEVLSKKVMSVLVEIIAPLEKLPALLQELAALKTKVNTVFCASLISRLDENGNSPVVEIARQWGFTPEIRTKTNIGMGKIPPGYRGEAHK